MDLSIDNVISSLKENVWWKSTQHILSPGFFNEVEIVTFLSSFSWNRLVWQWKNVKYSKK